MKRRIFFGSVFFIVFLRLQIYEAIAAIFWQSARYVVYFALVAVNYYRFFALWLLKKLKFCLHRSFLIAF